MAQLTFSGRSPDGGHLLLKDASGRTYTLAVDARLRSALRSKPDRNGQLEIPMESALRPRDIQARIRAGETPEDVAHAAGTSVEKIMPYAAPVLAERAHVAQRAQLSSVRRRTSDSGARTLGEAVEAQLRAHNVDPDGVEWDAWRREDGRWTLTAEFSAGPRSGTATYSFDMRGNFVTLDDEDAHWLVGDGPVAEPAPSSRPSEQPPADDLAAARQRRLSAVSADELPLGADAIEMVAEGAPPASPERAADEPTASETTLELGLDDGLGQEQPVESFLDAAPPADPDAAERHNADTEAAAEESTTAPPAQEPPARKANKRRGRASVPSWDEIMFGGGKGD